MSDPDAAAATMLANLPAKTGRTMEEWFAVLEPLGLQRHGQVLAHLKQEHGVGHGFANLIALKFLSRTVPEASSGDLVEAQYAGPKAALRPIYEAILAAVTTFGDDVEVAPKKAGVSLRRSKQFALVEPKTRTRVDLGLNLKGEPGTARLRVTGGMCTHSVALGTAAEVDDELIALLRQAYERA